MWVETTCEHSLTKLIDMLIRQVGGPMWLGPIQNQAFAERVLKGIQGQQGDYATWARMQGMLTIAKEVNESEGSKLTRSGNG